ncbi:putative molybdenum carrier protein [bacterium]|nr:putative molybdenum carrier protein [bacterium]
MPKNMNFGRPDKIISGGQAGVDRAALDVALNLKISCGGWCPRGRSAEDGRIAEKYPLQATPDADYSQRTRWNVRDADGTLILKRGKLSGGTALTVALAKRLNKPCLILDLDSSCDPETICQWIIRHKIQVLNIAGPRESQNPGIYYQAKVFLETWMKN